MQTMLIMSLIFLCKIYAHYCQGIKDLIEEGYFGKDKTKFKIGFNKYKLDENGKLIPYTKKWYYFGFKKFEPKWVEKIPYSYTFLSFLFDKWHWNKAKFQTLTNMCMRICLYYPVIEFENIWYKILFIESLMIACKFCEWIGFNLSYTLKFVRK